MRKRFGDRQGVLQRYWVWLEQHHPGSSLLDLVPSKSRHEIVTPTSPIKVPSVAAQWAKGSGVVFGAPINLRGLRHAPVNEQGVVYRFGMVSSELGLIVEAVQSAYPDCEAKRRVDSRLDRWQRVRIEFEFYSSNFKDHGHDPAGCDLIVCWEHDWPECPLEGIELRSVIDQLEGELLVPALPPIISSQGLSPSRVLIPLCTPPPRICIAGPGARASPLRSQEYTPPHVADSAP